MMNTLSKQVLRFSSSSLSAAEKIHKSMQLWALSSLIKPFNHWKALSQTRDLNPHHGYSVKNLHFCLKLPCFISSSSSHSFIYGKKCLLRKWYVFDICMYLYFSKHRRIWAGTEKLLLILNRSAPLDLNPSRSAALWQKPDSIWHLSSTQVISPEGQLWELR